MENDNKLEITSTDAVVVLLTTAIITGIYIWHIQGTDGWGSAIPKSSTAIPLFTLIATLLLKIKDWVILMFSTARRYRRRLRDEGKAERDAEWIEWANNGKDPDKMPSKINPVKPIQNVQKGKKDFSDNQSD